MPNIIKSLKEIEWEFARAVEPFLPKELKLGSGFDSYPHIYQSGFFGFFDFYDVASFAGTTEIRIKNAKWKDVILDSITKYEKENAVTVNVVIDTRT
jgi:hypothetical protein